MEGRIDAVRNQAVDPWTHLPVPPDVELVSLDGATIGFNKWPNAQLVRIDDGGPADLPAAVAATREAARERGKSVLAWWVTPEHDALAPELAACGLVNEDTPGFEAIENAMALVEPPSGEVNAAVEVRVTETWEEFLQTFHVTRSVFGMPDMAEEELRERYAGFRHPDNPGREFFAVLDGRAVATSFAVAGDAAVNLFGGAVLEEARGRGVYRALVQARWAYAVDCGTPALTVQAGRLSRPILERLGFELVASVRLYVDTIG